MPAGAGETQFVAVLIFPDNPVSRQAGNVISGHGGALLGGWLVLPVGRLDGVRHPFWRA